MGSDPIDPRAGALIAAALVVSAGVAVALTLSLLAVEDATTTSTVRVGGVTTEDLERLADSLDRLAEEPLTAPEREAVEQVEDVVDGIRTGATPVAPTPPPPTIPEAVAPTAPPPTSAAPAAAPEARAETEIPSVQDILDAWGSTTPTTTDP